MNNSTSSTRLISTLGLVAAFSGFLIVFVFQSTKPHIDENKRVAIESAVFKVVPVGATIQRSYVLTDEGLQIQGKGEDIYAAYDKNNQLIGIALNGAAQGYAGIINLLYGYNPRCECITGFKVIKMTETPGLGDKIVKDPAFLSNFQALEAKLRNDKNALNNEIITVYHGKKTHPWQIDAISGATISSKAVGKAINNSARQVLPQLFSQLPSITQLDGQYDKQE